MGDQEPLCCLEPRITISVMFCPLYPTVIVQGIDCEFQNLQMNGKMCMFPNFFFFFFLNLSVRVVHAVLLQLKK